MNSIAGITDTVVAVQAAVADFSIVAGCNAQGLLGKVKARIDIIKGRQATLLFIGARR